ncbi:HAD-IIB family hydrolase [Noviherbaspirillum cavernae]|uniref:HAD-IIB family hydrolase n=1 Tax=Noviherbaspirillum cavernae TaxID=2320862 RepID=A0A418WV82_9BURK|nr:HAD-IIB family hydrolase [Noviherbaspirillum cavernae]RJF96612.1 HAD-IIB family hydrolase [Noviherbaspirillum cavernae]
MKPVNQLPAAQVTTVFTDIDDTLTTEGKLGAQAYAALQALQDAGLRVIPVTGRPAGWCDHIARMWPVDGIIGENGALYMWHDHASGKLRTRHLLDAPERAGNAARLAQVREQVLREVPGCAVASDQFCRQYDLAIDFCEDVPALERDDVDRIVRIMEQAGMTAKISSIHVNGWFGDYDKLSMARLMMRERYGIDLGDEEQRARCVFAGDSPNDAPMFAYFPLSVGVANVLAFSDRLPHPPHYITHDACGAGFAELAQHLLSDHGHAS